MELSGLSNSSSLESDDSNLELRQDGSVFHRQLEGYQSSEDDREVSEAGLEPKAMAARAYQLEMLEQSLERNIIVAMDTGSGKTQVAVLRIKAELDKPESEKRIWFLANTVALCEQQYNVLRSQITSVQVKFLCGADGVDNWSEQSVWDGVLYNVRLVVSTYQVLFDAMMHDFVRLDTLALIVFDEAHNCTGKFSGKRIMKERYWPAKMRGDSVPAILGLTASPLTRSKLDDLEELESTLDAVCRTPNRQREELISYVNRPQMILVPYGPAADPTPENGWTQSMLSLRQVYISMDIMQDPYVKRLRAANTERSMDKLRKAISKNRTYVSEQVKQFLGRSIEMCRQLGPWAADYYIREVLGRYAQIGDGTFSIRSVLWDEDERDYLKDVLQRVRVEEPGKRNLSEISEKLEHLLRILIQFTDDPVGIIFVKERATVAVLTHILAIHPATADRYRLAGMVGTSQYTARDPMDIKEYADLTSLENFRRGRVNLLVATSVAEEGIDVPACNMVICFEKPANLKSFIQRRGRARMRSSRLYLMLDDASRSTAMEWQALEAEMKRRYEDDMRALQEISAIEDAESTDYPPLLSKTTGARLTIDDAKSHLENFCASLSSTKFVESSPYYLIRDATTGETPADGCLTLTATVLLPLSLPSHLRRIQGNRMWRSEKNATKDAAFQAYKALYEEGLVNDNLLSLRTSDLAGPMETRVGKAQVRVQFNPWHIVAQGWRCSKDVYRQSVRFYSQDRSMEAGFEILLPVPCSDLGRLVLHWSSEQSFTIETIDCSRELRDSSAALDHSRVLLQLAYGHRWEAEEKTPLVGFSCPENETHIIHRQLHVFAPGLPRMSLVMDATNACHPYYYEGVLPEKPPRESVRQVPKEFDDMPQETSFVAVRNWPKKAGYFRPQPPGPAPPSKPYARVVPAANCIFDGLPPVLAHFGMLIPSITHAIEIRLVASELFNAMLSKVGFTDADLPLILEAICASSAREPKDYERIEFLGDSILKFCATINCAAKFPHFPEGYLSAWKDRFVSNARLFRAAIDSGLDRYIITDQVTLNKWRPKYVEDTPDTCEDAAMRELSTKTLADVVEAIIGAAYVTGGIERALAVINAFLPEHNWQDLRLGRQVLWEVAPANSILPTTLAPVEELIGYTFRRKSLLIDALTHSSYNAPGTTGCLERLEFIGDAVLDNLVVNKLFAIEPALSHVDMHLIRTALVNGDFLAFLVMEWAIKTQEMRIKETLATTMTLDGGSPKVTAEALETIEILMPLWSFMRHSAPVIALTHLATSERHAELRKSIIDAFDHSQNYPWALLARLQAQKFYSDLFESVLGAVWIDSDGSDEVCERFLERSGVLPYMRRILRDKVHIWHPKEELGRLADREKVRYEDATSKHMEQAGTGKQEKEYLCRVFVGDRLVAQVEGGVAKEEARTKAAEDAVRILKELRHDDDLMGDA